MVRASATHPTAQLMEKAQAVKGRSLLADARRRLFRNKAAVASMALLAADRAARGVRAVHLALRIHGSGLQH